MTDQQPANPVAQSGAPEVAQRATPGVTRLSFLKSSTGVAAGAAAIALPGASALAQERAVPTDPSSPNPREPVMAYVRDAAKGEVTVMAGTHERTYRDKTLVKRMLKHAPNHGGTI